MKKYGNDYRQSGKQFEYTGKWYSTKDTLNMLKKYACIYTGLMIACILVYVVGLMPNNTGSRIFFILLPYVTMVFPISYGIMGGVSLLLFCRKQEGKGTSQVVVPEEHLGHMTRAEFEKGIRRPVRCSIGITVLGCITSVADLILMIQNPSDLILTRELVFEAAAVVILILGSVTTAQSWKIKAKFTISG